MRVAFGVAIAICALTLASCGSSASDTATPTSSAGHTTQLGFLDISSGPTPQSPTPPPPPTHSGRAVIQADLSSATSAQDTIGTLEQVIQDRLGDAGVHSDISQTSDAELTIDFTGTRSTDFVKQVIEAQNLNFREPIINSGEVICRTSDGAEFPVPASVVQVTANHAGARSASCSSNDGHTGSVKWEPVQADVDGTMKTLTQSMIEAGRTEIKSTQLSGTILLLSFNDEGNAVVTAATAHLVSYPLGIFLGDTLLEAPTVQGQISTATVEITSLSDDELAAAKAVIKGGELPVPVSITSIAPDSPAP